jgi:peptide/nickel transport system permease protein
MDGRAAGFGTGAAVALAPVAARRRRPEEGPWRSAARRVWRNPLGATGVTVVALVTLVAVLAPVLAPYDPYSQYAGRELVRPLSQHVLGSDELGRDTLSRLIYGTRLSLLVGIVSVALGAGVGVTTGLVAGYWGGWLEAALMRVWDAVLAFPAILLGIAVATVLGPGLVNAALAVGIVNIPQFSRISRASALAEKEKDYVQAARASGLGDFRIVFRHVLPNTVAPLLIQATLAMACAVLLEAGLSFLGLGAQPPEPSWGSMLNSSRSYLREAPWYGIFPGLALSLLLLGLNFLADAVRDALDPRQKHLI